MLFWRTAAATSVQTDLYTLTLANKQTHTPSVVTFLLVLDGRWKFATCTFYPASSIHQPHVLPFPEDVTVLHFGITTNHVLFILIYQTPNWSVTEYACVLDWSVVSMWFLCKSFFTDSKHEDVQHLGLFSLSLVPATLRESSHPRRTHTGWRQSPLQGHSCTMNRRSHI